MPESSDPPGARGAHIASGLAPSDEVMSKSAELEARYEAIVASAEDAIVSKTLDGIVRSWNAGAEKIFGYTAEEMIGQSLLVLFPPERRDEEPMILARIARGERVEHFETVRIHKSGRPIDVSVTISPIRAASGQVIGASKVARDITWMKLLAGEREQALRREQEARREAERVNRVKDEFLATLSHELRTPLNAILGWAQLLQDMASMPTEALRGLDTIARNARAQAKLIDDLLDVSRIVAGKMQLAVEWVDLAMIVVERMESLRPAADAKRIALSRDIDPELAPMLGDARRLQQVVWNLLSNAIRYTPEGGRVDVHLRRHGGRVELRVADSGIGIAPEFLPVLFSRFSQADASTTRQHGGLGLGLAIVRHLVELHGGTVVGTSAGLGLGAEFTVWLPQGATSRIHHTHAPIEGPRTAASRELGGARVLVVDDHADARDLAALVLTGANATVSIAADADTALALLRNFTHDALVCDLAMPGTDGLELMRRIRAEGHALPAIALTAFAHPDEQRRAFDAGFQLHLAKPFDPASLVAAVAGVLATPS